MDIREKIAQAIRDNNIEALRMLKEELGRNRWLEAWKANGKGMEAWLEPNPFVIFKDTKP